MNKYNLPLNQANILVTGGAKGIGVVIYNGVTALGLLLP